MRRTRNYLNRNFKKLRSKDTLTKEKRSKLMSKIRSKNTNFEQFFIDALRSMPHITRFETHRRDIKGNPDIVFEKQQICVFLDSDFWHGWQYPRWKHLLKDDFWRDKIFKNRARDRRNTAYLRKHGWKVLRIWEHEIKSNISQVIDRIQSNIKE